MKGLLVCLLLCADVARAQEDFRWVQFHFVRPGMPVPEYTLQMYEMGGGSYKAKNVVVPSANKYAVTPAVGGGDTVQFLAVKGDLPARVFALVKAAHELAHCDAHKKGIADTGEKQLTLHEAYADVKLARTCTYNYSEDKAVVELTTLFQAMAATLDMGRKMERDHQYDRLALDGDMTLLVEMVKDGRAVGVANIKGTLEALASDPDVLERVRVQAGKLVELGDK